MTHNQKTGRWRGILVGTLAVGLAVTTIQRAHAQNLGDSAEGRRLAETWCSSCHVTSPTSERGTSSGAPTFSAVANMKSTTPLGLRVFLQTPHARMPDLHLTRNETDDLIAYILSLRK